MDGEYKKAPAVARRDFFQNLFTLDILSDFYIPGGAGTGIQPTGCIPSGKATYRFLIYCLTYAVSALRKSIAFSIGTFGASEQAYSKVWSWSDHLPFRLYRAR